MPAPAARVRSGEGLQVERLSVAAFATMEQDFADLSARSIEANPHFSPASVSAASHLVEPGRIVILAASQAARLVGIWAFGLHAGAGTGGLTVLRTPLVPLYEVLSSPVLDRNHGPAALEAMFAFIAASLDLPSLIMARSLPLDGPSHEVLKTCLVPPLRRLVVSESWIRGVTLPHAGETPDAAIHRAHGSSRKKRQTQRRALERLGTLNFVEHTGTAAVAALEEFLLLEAQGWKGAQGTALLKHPDAAAWMRLLALNLAATGNIRISALMLDGRPAAMGVLIEQAGVVLFLKTAFDESLSKYSPGLQLEIDVTHAALARGGLIRFDCGAGDDVDPAAHIWPERRQMGHVLIQLDNSPMHALPALATRARAGLRSLRNRWRG